MIEVKIRTGYWCVDLQNVRLLPEQIRRGLQYPQRLLLTHPPLTIEVIFEERYIWF